MFVANFEVSLWVFFFVLQVFVNSVFFLCVYLLSINKKKLTGALNVL